MAVLVEGALLVLEVRHPVADAPPTVIATRVRLDDRADLVVEETYEQADGVQVCRRVWKLDTPSLSFRLRGAEALSGDGPDANERLGGAIAAALGWPTP